MTIAGLKENKIDVITRKLSQFVKNRTASYKKVNDSLFIINFSKTRWFFKLEFFKTEVSVVACDPRTAGKFFKHIVKLNGDLISDEAFDSVVGYIAKTLEYFRKHPVLAFCYNKQNTIFLKKSAIIIYMSDIFTRLWSDKIRPEISSWGSRKLITKISNYPNVINVETINIRGSNKTSVHIYINEYMDIPYSLAKKLIKLKSRKNITVSIFHINKDKEVNYGY